VTKEKERVRWRMTLDELAHACNATANDLDTWATAGAMGDRWREKRDRGKWRHIDKGCAQRAVICSRLLATGMSLEAAARISTRHTVGDYTEFWVSPAPKVSMCISREDLP
jgi:hypothetical protein